MHITYVIIKNYGTRFLLNWLLNSCINEYSKTTVEWFMKTPKMSLFTCPISWPNIFWDLTRNICTHLYTRWLYTYLSSAMPRSMVEKLCSLKRASKADLLLSCILPWLKLSPGSTN